MLRLFKCYVKICMANKAERVGTQSMVLSVGKEPCGQEEVPRAEQVHVGFVKSGFNSPQRQIFPLFTVLRLNVEHSQSFVEEDVCLFIQQPEHKADHSDLNAEIKNV
jgi:hypothetical protein